MARTITGFIRGLLIVLILPFGAMLAYLMFPYFYVQASCSLRGKRIRLEDWDIFCRLFTVLVIWAAPLASYLLEIRLK